MSALSDLLSTAQQAELELKQFSQGELQGVKDLVKELRENLDVLVHKEVDAPAPPANPGAGVQTSSDLTG